MLRLYPPTGGKVKHNFEQMLEQAQQDFIVSLPYEDLTFCSAQVAAQIYAYYKNDWTQAPYWLIGYLEPIGVMNKTELQREYLSIVDGRQIWEDFFKETNEDKTFANKMKSVPREQRHLLTLLADKILREQQSN
jgi:hypothetical protein